MGRRISVNTPRAIQRREQMRRAREAMRQRPTQFNPIPLMRAIKEWKRETHAV